MLVRHADVLVTMDGARRELRDCVFEVLRELTTSEAELREEARALLDPS